MCPAAPGAACLSTHFPRCRKAGIILLARLVPNALTQIAAFEILICFSIILHISLRPYAAWRHQFAEGLSLVCIMLTAALAILVQPTAGHSPAVITGVTIVMLLINAGTVAFLAQQYVALCCLRNAEHAEGLARFVRRRMSRRPSSAALRLSQFQDARSKFRDASSASKPRSNLQLSLPPLSPALQLAASTAASSGPSGAWRATKPRSDPRRRLRAADARPIDGGASAESEWIEEDQIGRGIDSFRSQFVANPLAVDLHTSGSGGSTSGGSASGSGGSSSGGSASSGSGGSSGVFVEVSPPHKPFGVEVSAR